MLDLHRLRVLRAVAQHGSFSRAAAALHLTPSAVSQHVAALERSIGLPVVERSPRGVRLTAPGRVLVETADAVEAELRGARQQLDRLAQGESGHLTVATFPSAGQRLLPAALSRFTAAHPGVEVSVIEAEPEESLPLVRAGRADLALVYRFTPIDRDGTDPGLRWTLLLTDPMYLVLPAAHPLAGAAELALADLAAERWLQGTGSTGEMLLHLVAAAGFTPRVACRSSDYLFMHALVGAGVGVALIPGLGLPDPPGERVAVIPVAPPRPVRYVYAVTPRRRWISPLAEALLADLLADLPAGAEPSTSGG